MNTTKEKSEMTLAEYPLTTDCGRCGDVYGRHRELECPDGDGTFSPVITISPNGRHETELASLRSELDAMTLSRDNFRTDVAQLRSQLANMLAQFGPGGEANRIACQAASDHGFCSEFDQIAEDCGLWRRCHDGDDDWWRTPKDWIAAVCVTVCFNVNVPMSGYKTASAAEDDISSDAIRAELRNTHGIRSDDISDWSVDNVEEDN
jgi:hypothetical protein